MISFLHLLRQVQEKATENMQRSYSKKAFPWDKARFHIPKVILSILSGVVRSTLMLLPTMMLQRLINSVTGDQAQSANTAVYGVLYVLCPLIVLVRYL